MKAKIHPKYFVCDVTCGCGAKFVTRSTKPSIKLEICSACHPFYTGRQKFVDTAGRVEKFTRKYNWGKKQAEAKAAAEKKKAAKEQAEKERSGDEKETFKSLAKKQKKQLAEIGKKHREEQAQKKAEAESGDQAAAETAAEE